MQCFGCLGFAAAAGVLAVFLSTLVIGRVAGTALIAAVAIAAAMPISRLLDHDKKRIGGIIGLASIVLGFIAAMATLWLDLFNTSWDLDFRLGMTAVIVPACGMTAGLLLASLEARWARWTVRTALVADVLAEILLLISVWTPSEDRPAETAGFLLVSGATIALSLIGVGIERRAWRWLGVLASAVALGLGFAGTWFVHSDDATAYIVAMCIAWVVAYAIVVLRVPLGEARFWTFFAAIGSTAAVGACVSLLALLLAGLTKPGRTCSRE